MNTDFNPLTGLPNNCIVLDTETTGFEPQEGHRIVEIGAIRMRDGLPTTEEFHTYVNPERNVPQGAFDVHGLSEAFLADKPLFAEVAQSFSDFVGGLPVVAHNAAFDSKFLNYELERAGFPPIPASNVHDSVAVARRLFPGAQASLDALCRRFKISLLSRDKHGALVDSKLLADVVVEMGGGRQQTLFAAPNPARNASQDGAAPAAFVGARPPVFSPDPAVVAAHRAYVEKALGPQSLWSKIYSDRAAASGDAPSEAA